MSSAKEDIAQTTPVKAETVGLAMPSTATDRKDIDDSPEDKNVDHIEKVLSGGGDRERIDPEVAKYAGGEIIEIDEATNKRLKKKIYGRILVIMTVSYFFQALDKGTLSFSSIMDLPTDTGLKGQEVCGYITK